MDAAGAAALTVMSMLGWSMFGWSSLAETDRRRPARADMPLILDGRRGGNRA